MPKEYLCLIISCFFFFSCEKESLDFSHFYEVLNVKYESYSIKDSVFVMDGFPYKITFYPQSREDVMTEDIDNGELSLTYLNVIKKNASYVLLYSCANTSYFDRELSGIEMRFKRSQDGIFWDSMCRVIAGKRSHAGVESGMESCLFYDKTNNIYKIIYNQEEGGKVKMFMMESSDCINWRNRKLITEVFYDSQFSVVEKEGKYFVYHRYWDGNWYSNDSGRRVIALTILSSSGEILSPTKILYKSSNEYFKHMYNSAVSNVDSEYDLCFPTGYNSDNQDISINMGFIRNAEDIKVSEYDLFKILSKKDEALWITVSPGLVPIDQLCNEYWMYYHLSYKKHGSTELKASKYCRIKLKLEKL